MLGFLTAEEASPGLVWVRFGCRPTRVPSDVVLIEADSIG